jgi:glycerophosphoryl diester phosphodiesterase
MVALPPVIGHRGAAGLAPENTLAGFRAAHAAGAGWVEFDVRLSRDRRCVVIHDATTERISARKARVSRQSLDQLRALDAGGWFGPAFAGEKVPELGEALDVLAELGLGANIELKPIGRLGRTLAETTVDIIRRRHHAPPGAAIPDVLVSSFSPAILGAVRDADRHIPRGLLMRSLRPDWRYRLRALGCASIHCAEKALTRPVVEAIKAQGVALVAFTVSDAATARRLWSWGVDAVITGVPDVLIKAWSGGRR